MVAVCAAWGPTAVVHRAGRARLRSVDTLPRRRGEMSQNGNSPLFLISVLSYFAIEWSLLSDFSLGVPNPSKTQTPRRFAHASARRALGLCSADATTRNPTADARTAARACAVENNCVGVGRFRLEVIIIMVKVWSQPQPQPQAGAG